MTDMAPYVYAAVLDILGYRTRLDSDRLNGTLNFRDELQRAMHILSDINEAVHAYQAISDTVIITCSNRDDFLGLLKVLKAVQLAFLKESMLIRGGVAFEQHFKSSHVTYSHAVARAYEIESKAAVYPRIAIDHNIVEMFEVNGRLNELVASHLICVLNGVHFVNILDDENWLDAYSWAKTLYERDAKTLQRRESEFSKHQWLEQYLFESPFVRAGYQRFIPKLGLLK